MQSMVEGAGHTPTVPAPSVGFAATSPVNGGRMMGVSTSAPTVAI